MQDKLFNTKTYLPKCILARIDKYWYPTIPTDYPASSSSFDFVKGDDKAATIAMEENLGTENSIIAPEDIPDQSALGGYLGTYDVEGEAGEETLLSPNKLPDNAIGALAYHYDAEADEWTKIEDANIQNGYVYGTLEEFSPIAVFAIKKSAYYDTTKSQYKFNVYVCNGIPTRVYRNDEGTVVAESDGIITELTEEDYVVGGSYDGSEVESTNVYIEGVKLTGIIGGSFTFGDSGIENKNHSKKIKLTVVDTEVAKSISGAGIWNSADVVEMNITGCKVPNGGIGNQISFFENHKSNATLEDSDKGLGANQWVKDSIINVKDSEVYILYSGAHNGNSTTMNATLYAENCKITYACNGQSNGTIYNVTSTYKNCEIEIFNNNNRGHYGDGKAIFKGLNKITNFYCLGDSSESDPQMADVRGKVSHDINATDVVEKFYVGAVSDVKVTTADEAAKYINSITISRNADVTYKEDADIILKDIIRIK